MEATRPRRFGKSATRGTWAAVINHVKTWRLRHSATNRRFSVPGTQRPDGGEATARAARGNRYRRAGELHRTRGPPGALNVDPARLPQNATAAAATHLKYSIISELLRPEVGNFSAGRIRFAQARTFSPCFAFPRKNNTHFVIRQSVSFSPYKTKSFVPTIIDYK